MSKSQNANNDTEVINADEIEGEDEILIEDESDELVIPEDPLGEEGDDSKKSTNSKKVETDGDDIEEEEGDEPDPEIDEEEIAEEPVDETDPEAEKDELKPVEGETPRERALRAALLKAKRELRAKKVRETMEGAAEGVDNDISDEDYDKLREIYDDDEIQRMETMIDIIARKKGYVKNEQLVANEGNNVLNEFIKAHPQYEPENDPNDKHWKTFVKILESDYNYKGKKPEQLKSIFAKVHADVNKELGIKDTTTAVAINKRKLDAQRQKIRTAGISGATGNSKPVNKSPEAQNKATKTIDPTVRSMFKGFDDSDFED